MPRATHPLIVPARLQASPHVLLVRPEHGRWLLERRAIEDRTDGQHLEVLPNPLPDKPGGRWGSASFPTAQAALSEARAQRELAKARRCPIPLPPILWVSREEDWRGRGAWRDGNWIYTALEWPKKEVSS